MTPPPTDTQLRPDKPTVRPALVALAVITVLAMTAGAYLIAHNEPRTPDDAPAPPARTATSPSHTLPDVTWRPIAGVPVPFSRLHGPRITAGGQAAGYSRSALGAAFAAVQVLARTSATTGPPIYQPVLATQVTGANVAAMKLAIAEEYERRRAAAGVADGAPIETPGTSVLGYVVTAYGTKATTAEVDVVLTSTDLRPAGRVIAFHLALVWQGADWKVLAPPNGDWASVTTLLDGPPPGLIDYGG